MRHYLLLGCQILALAAVTLDLVRRVAPDEVPFLPRLRPITDPRPAAQFGFELVSFDGKETVVALRAKPLGASRLLDLAGECWLGDEDHRRRNRIEEWAGPGADGSIELRLAIRDVSWTKVDAETAAADRMVFRAPVRAFAKVRFQGTPVHTFLSRQTLEVESGPGYDDLVRHLGGGQ